MEELTLLEKLDQKVMSMITTYSYQKDEIQMLRQELVALKAQSAIKDQEIQKLSDENNKKDIEIENIVNKIESLLG